MIKKTEKRKKERKDIKNKNPKRPNNVQPESADQSVKHNK